jgi:hypothetical protein
LRAAQNIRYTDEYCRMGLLADTTSRPRSIDDHFSLFNFFLVDLLHTFELQLLHGLNGLCSFLVNQLLLSFFWSRRIWSVLCPMGLFWNHQ